MVDVSVIIPAYNRLWCLPRAIASCKNTRCNTEVIVVDDGSTDGTWDWLQQQPDLITVRQENQGQTYALNTGFSLARGQYIRFLDSDDFLEKGIIDRQFEKALSTSAKLIYSRVDQYDEQTQKISKCPEVEIWEDFLEVQLSNRYGSHFLGMLFHRDLVEQVPRRAEFALREDRMFLLEVGLLDPEIARVDGCAGYWVKHSAQMQANYLGFKAQVTNWQHLSIYQVILKKLEASGRLTPARKKAACTVLWLLAHWIAKHHLTEAMEIIEWIYQLDPTFQIPGKGVLGFFYRRAGFKITERLLRFRRELLHP